MANNNVMNEMVGKWKLEKRDNNFDEFLSCRQVGWFLRKLMTSSVADVEYSLSQDANTFTKVMYILFCLKNCPIPHKGLSLFRLLYSKNF